MASQIRRAFERINSNTGFMSPGDALMTLSTSEVAVCCCSNSSRSRVFGLNLVEQPSVLDSDHSLVGECFQKFDLGIGEAPALATAHVERADRHAPRIIGTTTLEFTVKLTRRSSGSVL